LVAIVVFGWGDLRVKRDVKIVVEIAAKRRKPRDAPSLERFIGFERGTRNEYKHGIAGVKQGEIAEGV
jgi:hypothetical protein